MVIISGFEDMDDEAHEQYIQILKTHEELIKLRKEGKSHEEIARIVGWKLKTVSVFLTTNQFSLDYKRQL